MHNKKLFSLILFCSILLLIAGLTSTLSLGDEVCHYRLAKDIFNAGRRAAFDSLYDSGSPPGYFYNSPPLWHILLASLWKLSGKISFPVAQFYHTIYYALLILFTYLLGKELYGQKQGLYAALIVATVPAIATFSVLFYLDIPATTLSILCLLLIAKRKFLWAGIVIGLMYFTKRNACFFVPAFFFLILRQTETSKREKIKNFCYFCIPAFLSISYDFLWRGNELKSVAVVNDKEVVSQGHTFEFLKKILTPENIFYNWNLRSTEYLNSHLSNPVDIVKYFGVVLLILLVIYVIFRKYEKKDLSIWILVVSYYLFFCYMFYPGSDIRYILPVMPLLAILASKVIVSFINTKWLKISFVLLCFLQFSGTILHVRSQRQIPQGIMDGFTYLRENTSRDALIMYPEYVILEQANRKFVWSRLDYLRLRLNDIFWIKDDDMIKELLTSSDVGYIAVKKSRIYDDSKVHHIGGYPKSFVERLPKFFFVKLVFDNEDMEIWKVLGESNKCK